MRVRILREAHEDIRDGRRFYDEQERGLGRYFSSTILADVNHSRQKLNADFGGKVNVYIKEQLLNG